MKDVITSFFSSTETKKPFQVIYNSGAIKTQSVDLNQFSADFSQEKESFEFSLHSGFKNPTWMFLRKQSLKTSSFLIEGLADDDQDNHGLKTDCKRTEHLHLKPVYCFGPVRLGKFPIETEN